ncbi:hypothetical protein HID58_011959 [Brassica napus]|uniref:SFR19-like C-terminal domain-containing protein n=2 Tax=Brassica TaxID=3705 RepID=A0ABQ8DZP8_BRANA|nr:protein FRIGIDA-ESSENTIAL 1 [Brassica napus]KAH0934842.1 hypothetical protein HID58_011959 [Brassica napus]
MHLPMYTSGTSNPSPGNALPNQMHLQQNHAPPHHAPPPPPASSQQFHSHLPPVSMLPPPPPLPPGATPLSQAFPNPFHPPPSFPLSFPLKSLEPPGMPLPPPPPSSSSPLFADTVCANPEATNQVGETVPLSLEGAVVEDAGSSSPHEKKAEHGSPLYDDPDIEMEDDITLPESNYPSQPLNYGSEANSVTGTTLPVSKSDTHIHQDVDDGSRQASSSPYSGRAKVVPECGLGDMYDPFVDSFEPASLKLDCLQEHEPVSDSYTVPKASISSNTPLNVEENNQDVVDKQALSESDTTARVSVSSNKPPDVEDFTNGNDVGAVVYEDNDELGENAGEGNSHETLTPNSNNEIPKANNSAREGDITRKKSRGDAKEKDSSRSMKLFQVALTKFVKDLLKPSWRQGNMSKEAFKTIVKRAVDKVSNSMEGRRVPKSKAKIDKYIDSSRDKLTKLVMGYVDKYVKA